MSKRTLLFDWHVERGANVADFGGYEMPLWYGKGAKVEHLAVLNGAGLFDTSHMAVFTVEGRDARALLQKTFTKDLDRCTGPRKLPLSAGRCVYGAFLAGDGTLIDDAITNQRGDSSYMVVVNAGMAGEVSRHVEGLRGDLDATVTDLTDKVAKFDIQGPAAARIMEKVLADPDGILEKMPYFSFKGDYAPTAGGEGAVLLTDGTPILLSRTGYTGEFGFEIFLDPTHFVKAWQMILDAGEPFGLIPCGLAARDSLRAGAVLPLSHQDVGPWPYINHPWPFALPYDDAETAFTKEFVGDKAILAVESPEYTLPFVGKDLRKVTLDENTVVLGADGNPMGTVLTCATDMGIAMVEGKIYSVNSPDKPEGFKAKGLCCGFIKVKEKLSFGDTVKLKDSRRTIEVTIVSDIRPHRTARRPMREMR